MADNECLEDQMEKMRHFQVVKLVLLIMLCKYWVLTEDQFQSVRCHRMSRKMPNSASLPCKMSFLPLQHGSWRQMQKMVVIGNLTVVRLFVD